VGRTRFSDQQLQSLLGRTKPTKQRSFWCLLLGSVLDQHRKRTS
jgi:hypothetical protein